MNKKLVTIGFTAAEWMCVLIAAFYALDQSQYVLFDTIGALMWLTIAGVCEIIKYRITHNE